MNSHTTEKFRKLYNSLPQEIQELARKSYQTFKADPYHPGLHFKRVHSSLPIYSARISIDYRAVGILAGDEITWFWIGAHTEYERIITKI